MDDDEARARAERLEEQLAALEALPGPARDTAVEAVAALLDLYGEALARLARRLPADVLAGDELVSHLLMVHGLHPAPVEQRVVGALDEVRPYLRSHGGDVELLDVSAGVVSLRLQGSCSGCAASRTTLELAVADAIRRAAPEVEDIRAQDGAPAATAADYDTCPLPMAPGGVA
jgi:Fe-S cluster biogenesis protein NfuA